MASGDSAFIHENFAIGFTCIGRYVDCPNNFDPPCAGLGACPCTGTQCFAERDHFDQCKCFCPQMLLAMHQSGEPDTAICGWQNTGHVFNANECSCDCPAGSYPTGGCSAAQRWNTRSVFFYISSFELDAMISFISFSDSLDSVHAVASVPTIRMETVRDGTCLTKRQFRFIVLSLSLFFRTITWTISQCQ